MLRAVLLDLDDTLLANRAAERAMLVDVTAAVSRELGEVPVDELTVRFLELREPLFRHVLDGSWSHARYREAHLRAMVEPWGEPSPALVDHVMALRDDLQARLDPAPGADALLAELRGTGLRLGLLTNGPSALQRAKLERAGWTDAFDAVGVSEELGAAKPDPAAFRAVLERLHVEPGDAAMVGDNLVNDVGGALDAGLGAAVWLRVDPPDPALPPAGVPVADALADVPGLLPGTGRS